MDSYPRCNISPLRRGAGPDSVCKEMLAYTDLDNYGFFADNLTTISTPGRREP